MPELITASIDVMKVDKTRLIPSKQAGNPAKYLSLVLVPLREPDQYGNSYLIKQSVSKEEREQGIELPILGNAKIFIRNNTKPITKALAHKPAVKPTDEEDSDVPF